MYNCKYFVVFKGDDTDFMGNQKFVIELQTELDLTGMSAHFRFLDFAQDFDSIPEDKKLEIVIPATSTSKFPLGTADAKIWLVDANGKKRTVANRIHFVVTNSVREAYDNDDPQAIAVVISGGGGTVDSISWNNITNKPQDLMMHREFSDLPAEDMIPAEVGLPEICNMLNQIKNLLRPAMMFVASMLTFTCSAYSIGTNALMNLKGSSVVVTNVDLSGLEPGNYNEVSNRAMNAILRTGGTIVKYDEWGVEQSSLNELKFFYDSSGNAIGLGDYLGSHYLNLGSDSEASYTTVYTHIDALGGIYIPSPSAITFTSQGGIENLQDIVDNFHDFSENKDYYIKSASSNQYVVTEDIVFSQTVYADGGISSVFWSNYQSYDDNQNLQTLPEYISTFTNGLISESYISTNNAAFIAAVTNCPVAIAGADTTLGEYGQYGTLGTILAAIVAALAALKTGKADAFALRYDIGTEIAISSASSEVVGGETVTYGEATLADRTANRVSITAAIAELRLAFPAAVSGKVRDFGLRVEVGTGSAALTAPALVLVAPTGETIKLENNSKQIPALADGAADAKGVTLLYFSETAPGIFLAKGEQVEEVA